LPTLEKLTEMIPSVALFVKLLNLGFGSAIQGDSDGNQGWLRGQREVEVQIWIASQLRTLSGYNIRQGNWVSLITSH